MKYLTIDIGGTNVKYALMDENSQIIEQDAYPSVYDLEVFAQDLSNVISQYADGIQGVAFSCPGTIDVEQGIIKQGGHLTFLNGFKLVDYVNEHFQLPASVMNDAKSAVLAELWKGHLQGVQNGLLLTLGSGLGGGIIVNGELFLGDTAQAGELSFITHSPASMGMDNCLGTSASSVNFIKKAASLLHLHNIHDGKSVFEVIKDEANEEVTRLFKDYCKNIAWVIHNIQMVLNMSHVVVGGGISEQPILIRELNKQYQALHDESPLIRDQFPYVNIDACYFHNDANLIGALYYFLTTHQAD